MNSLTLSGLFSGLEPRGAWEKATGVLAPRVSLIRRGAVVPRKSEVDAIATALSCAASEVWSAVRGKVAERIDAEERGLVSENEGRPRIEEPTRPRAAETLGRSRGRKPRETTE